jgi:hypothetical protein
MERLFLQTIELYIPEDVFMFKSGFVLSTVAQIQATMFNNTDVIVNQNGKILEYGDPIESHSELAVKINGESYLKSVNFEFARRLFYKILT